MDHEEVIKASILFIGALILIVIISGMTDSFSQLNSVSNEEITVAGTATGTTNALAHNEVKVGSESITTSCPA